MGPDKELDDLINGDEYKIIEESNNGLDKEELKAKLQSEEEKLIAEILLVNLDNAEMIQLDSTDKGTKEEIKSIAHDMVDIAEIW